MQKANAFLTSMLISRYCHMLQRVSSMHAPIVYPAAFGILSGGTTTGKHVFSQKNGNKEKPEEDHEEGTSINVI